MVRDSLRSRRIWLAAAVALACLVALAAVALAAKPVKNSKYSGTLNGVSTEKVTFKVNKSGTKVTGFKVTPFFPNACGAGGQPPKYTSKPATIRNGKFHTRVSVITSTGTKLPAGKAAGRFLAKGKESGTVTPVKLPKNCIKPFPYTTKATK